jgi:hypothetical protein
MIEISKGSAIMFINLKYKVAMTGISKAVPGSAESWRLVQANSRLPESTPKPTLQTA